MLQVGDEQSACNWISPSTSQGFQPSLMAVLASVIATAVASASPRSTFTGEVCRSAGAAETMEAFWRFGVRDFRNIGHKAIFTAQCWRTLQAIGWQHAEPVLRSLAFGVLDLQRDTNRAAVGPYEANLENVKKIRDGWQVGKADPAAARDLLEALRTASAEEASAAVTSGLSTAGPWSVSVVPR